MCPPNTVSCLLLTLHFFFLYFLLSPFSHSLKSCLIWKLASFGKLAIRTILLEYVSVSLVFLPINSWSRGSGQNFPLDCCSSMEAWHLARSRHSCWKPCYTFGALAIISLPCSHYYLNPSFSVAHPPHPHMQASVVKPNILYVWPSVNILHFTAAIVALMVEVSLIQQLIIRSPP